MTDAATVALVLAAVAGVWLLACSATAIGVFLGMAALHYRVLRADQEQEQAAQAPEATPDA